MAETIIEIEVEVTRTETVYFLWDEDSANPVQAFLRKLQYHMHSAKSLVRGETPKLLSWKQVDKEDAWGQIRWTLDDSELVLEDDKIAGTCIDPDCECGGYIFYGQNRQEVSRKMVGHRHKWGLGTI